jgi:hypothetical protein
MVMHNAITILFVASFAVLSGCGGKGLFSNNRIEGGSFASLGGEFDIADVTVAHHSTRCGANFAGPCPKGMDPSVEIHIDANSVIFDFSNVTESGSFEGADFEGYILEVARSADSPILFARVDTDATTLDVEDADLAYDEEHLEVNLSGVEYDGDGFVKIDLLVGPLNLLQRGTD